MMERRHKQAPPTNPASVELRFDCDDAREAEALVREMIPGIQVRVCGPGYGTFPHPKRSPHVDLLVDGSGRPLSACWRRN
jgi:hypothetical protein